MPASQIRPQLHSITLAKLASLKPYWRVAMSALLRRAADLGTLTQRTKQYLWTQMGMPGDRNYEPVEIPSEAPTLLKELLDFHRERLGHDAQELAKIMRANESALMEKYLRDGSLGGLRLVRNVSCNNGVRIGRLRLPTASITAGGTTDAPLAQE